MMIMSLDDSDKGDIANAEDKGECRGDEQNMQSKQGGYGECRG